MRKILIVAHTEFSTLVRSKAFIAGVLLLPVMMGLSLGLTRATRRVTDNKDRTFAIVDYTGVVGAPLAAVAKLFDPGTQLGDTRPGGAASSRFIAVPVDTAGRQPDDLRLELSDRVRKGELFAFVEVPANVIDPAADARIQYYSDHPSYTTLPTWLRVAANGVIISERFRRASIDRALVARLSKQATVDSLDLFERGADGTIKPAGKVDTARAIGVPIAIMGLMFITIMSSGPGLLNSVIEEKMSRISEVLMGSLTPFQLMVGKLVGSVSVSVLLATIYVAGGLITARYYGGYTNTVTASLLAWFLALSGDVDSDVRGRVHRRRRGVLRPEGLPGHDDPGHDAPDGPDVSLVPGAPRPRRHDVDIAVARADRSAVPDDAANLARPGPAGMADCSRGRIDGGNHRRDDLGGGENLPHRLADAGQDRDTRRDDALGSRSVVSPRLRLGGADDNRRVVAAKGE